MKRESVWDYPRPPRVEPDARSIRVVGADTTIARTDSSSRVLETSHPPVFYIPPEDIDMALLARNERKSFCEFKGQATYWDLRSGRHIPSVGWSYEWPLPGYESLRGWVAFYPSKVSCYVDGELGAR